MTFSGLVFWLAVAFVWAFVVAGLCSVAANSNEEHSWPVRIAIAIWPISFTLLSIFAIFIFIWIFFQDFIWDGLVTIWRDKDE